MKISRRFTVKGKSPYEGIPFTKRSSEIRNTNGSLVFEARDIDVPQHWSQVAVDILAQKYFRKAGARVFGGENGFSEEKTFEPFEAPTTPDGDERLGWRGPTPRAARVPRATSFSPM